MTNKTNMPLFFKKAKNKALAFAIGLVAIVSGVSITAAQSDYGDLIDGYSTLNGGKPVVTAKSNDLNSQNIMAIESIMAKGVSPDFIVNRAGWQSNTKVVTNGSTVGKEDFNSIFSNQGFKSTDWAKSGIQAGDSVIIENIGYGTDLSTGEKINLDVRLEVEQYKLSWDIPNTSLKWAIRNNNGVLFHHFLLIGDVQPGGTTGDTPGGSGEGGEQLEAGALDSVTYSYAFYNHNTGKIISENSLMGIRYSDIDQTQKVSLRNANDVLGYILGQNSHLEPTKDGVHGFETTSKRTVADDPSKLTPYSVLGILNNNDGIVTYDPTAPNTSNIAMGIFGNYEFNIGWQIEIDKSIDIVNNKTFINNNYSFNNIYFDIIKDENKNGKLDDNEKTKLGTIQLDKDGKGKSDFLMDNYVLLVEHSSNLANTNQEFVTPVGVHGEFGDVKTVKLVNKSLLGENQLNKQDKETATKHQGNASFIGAQYVLYHKDGTPVKWTETNPNNLPQFEVTAGKKAESIILNGVDKTTDFADQVVLEVTDQDADALIGITNLPAGEYYWQEINAPEGYVLDTSKIEFSIRQSTEDQTFIETETTVSKEQVLNFKVRLHKFIVTNDTNAGVNDVEFTATGINGNTNPSVSGMTTIDQATDEDGYTTLQLPYGDWRIDETLRAPGMDRIAPLYIHMYHDTETDKIVTQFHMKDDFSDAPIYKRQWSASDNQSGTNPNLIGTVAGYMNSDKYIMTSSTIEAKDEPDLEKNEPVKDVQLTSTSESINHGKVALDSNFVYVLKAKRLDGALDRKITSLSIYDDFDENYDHYTGSYRVYFSLPLGEYKVGDEMPADFWTVEYDEKTETVKLIATQKLLDLINANVKQDFDFEVHTDMFRIASANKIINPNFIQNTNGQEVKSNPVDTKTPKLEPHKYSLTKNGFDIKGNKLLNDDSEQKNVYTGTNKNPYSDKTKNNEKENINTLVVKKGQKFTYQLWMDTRAFNNNSLLNGLRMVDDFDETMLNANAKDVKVYSKATGKDVTTNFRIYIESGKLYVVANKFVEIDGYKAGTKAQIIDTKAIPLGDYYKIDFPVTVKSNANINKDIINTASQDVVGSEGCGDYDPSDLTNPNNPKSPSYNPDKVFESKCNEKLITEKRVNPLTPNKLTTPMTGATMLPILISGALLVTLSGVLVTRRKISIINN
ncbi:LPXTG cell wall anchor domain-containing protein [Erysipelotrichaceae bacterium OttesenSCG-928-M19]|nr:LPXTG cell wall anchor domain-containing protein [Erysipelotrichaceae bacterium OttesenSCG-928-M19]